MTPAHFSTRPGESFPYGASVNAAGVNFVMLSRHAARAWLVLYRSEFDLEPLQVVELDPVANRTFLAWHVLVEDAGPGLWYAWRVDGPGDTARTGLRFDPHRDLLDPWARELTTAHWDRAAACLGEPGSALRARVVAEQPYDWEGDQPLRRRPEDGIIYELHVGGYTRHPSARVGSPGTFRGLVEKIPHLQALGVTDVELMPVMAFDEQDLPASAAERGLRNYWGYSPWGFFALHPRYCGTGDGRREFRDLVKALHRAGIGVILDVVFNHTAEGGSEGPVIAFKGYANEIFYHLDPRDRRLYRDYSGCGNTLNCNHPVVSRLLVECLEYWVREMHVDGFRFDLASVLARGEDGRPMHHPPSLWNIEFSEVLAHTRIIAEAWDAGGLYQVGDFPGYRWAEWNGRYRDSVRRFVRGDPGLIGEIASRLAGSSDLYASAQRLPINSVNFVTCHDGFTLLDLVSYGRKHNEANGERNRDGLDENLSWNCGAEGPTTDAGVRQLRERQARNLVAIMLLSQGVPMLLAGDEMLRSQGGNNNAYCQDNPTSWMDWSLADEHADFLRFVRELVRLRRRHRSLRRARFLTGAPGPHAPDLPDVRWYGDSLAPPHWNDPAARILAFTLAPQESGEPLLHVMMNMSGAVARLPQPEVAGCEWYVAVDTARPAPLDACPPEEQQPARGGGYPVAAHAVVVLEGWRGRGSKVPLR